MVKYKSLPQNFSLSLMNLFVHLFVSLFILNYENFCSAAEEPLSFECRII